MRRNGAGKIYPDESFKWYSSIYGSYEGDIIYNREVCKFNTLHDSEAKVIIIIHQELALIPMLSIGENMFLGNRKKENKFGINWDETYSEAEKTYGSRLA